MAAESVFATTSPGTGETLEAIEATSLEAIPEVVSRAREAQAKWAELSLEKRIKVITKVKTRILERADAAGVDAEGHRFLERELAAPKSPASIAAATRREIADDVYAASVLAISLDTDAERAYLDELARALSLDEARRTAIHARVEAID